MPPIPLTMNTRYLLAVTVGVPEEPKEGIAETSSKFFGTVYLKNPFTLSHEFLILIYELFNLPSFYMLIWFWLYVVNKVLARLPRGEKEDGFGMRNRFVWFLLEFFNKS